MEPYIHDVKYYETDKMGVTHHSNYIRWMEEARVHFLDGIGFGYDRMEAEGIISPVLEVECQYKKTTTFHDQIAIQVRVKEFNGVRFTIEYEMKKVGEDDVVCTSVSKHCFLGKDFKPIRMKRDCPELYELLCSVKDQA